MQGQLLLNGIEDRDDFILKLPKRKYSPSTLEEDGDEAP